MNQERFNKLYNLVEEAQDARKNTELNSKLRRLQNELEREANHNRDLDHPEEVCPECDAHKDPDVFVCDNCWENKDQNRLTEEHR